MGILSFSARPPLIYGTSSTLFFIKADGIAI